MSEGTTGIVKAALDVMAKAEFGSLDFETARRCAWLALDGSDQEQLMQLLQGPTYDGDVIGKSTRDRLLSLGLAVRCCKGMQQGYTVATYLGYTVWHGQERAS